MMITSTSPSTRPPCTSGTRRPRRGSPPTNTTRSCAGLLLLLLLLQHPLLLQTSSVYRAASVASSFREAAPVRRPSVTSVTSVAPRPGPVAPYCPPEDTRSSMSEVQYLPQSAQ